MQDFIHDRYFITLPAWIDQMLQCVGIKKWAFTALRCFCFTLSNKKIKLIYLHKYGLVRKIMLWNKPCGCLINLMFLELSDWKNLKCMRLKNCYNLLRILNFLHRWLDLSCDPFGIKTSTWWMQGLTYA